jgi:hypothetical protein
MTVHRVKGHRRWTRRNHEGCEMQTAEVVLGVLIAGEPGAWKAGTPGSGGGCTEKARTHTGTGPRRAAHPTGNNAPPRGRESRPQGEGG